jgi:anti-sigma regulatory factor (Ser/Thr protein kinase)
MHFFKVREAMDLYGPRRAIRDYCETLGFARSDCQELAIVVSELTSNILKYGIVGSIEFCRDSAPAHGTGIRIVARDMGPPFFDFELALRDGYNDRGPIDPVTLLRRGGLGTGLGAVQRLSDSLKVEYLPGGKAIEVIRYLKRLRRKS